jgi:hypothetical protein
MPLQPNPVRLHVKEYQLFFFSKTKSFLRNHMDQLKAAAPRKTKGLRSFLIPLAEPQTYLQHYVVVTGESHVRHINN